LASDIGSAAPIHDTPERIRQELLERGWKQGSVLPPALSSEVRLNAFADTPSDTDTAFLVVSQDCDVVNGRLDREPAVEVIAAQLLSHGEKRFEECRDPRTLHVKLTRKDGTPQVVGIQIRNRGSLDRRLLLAHSPGDELVAPPPAVSRISSFLGRRYIRPAFPDAFEKRFERAKEKLIGLLRRYHEHILDIQLRLEPSADIEPSSDYHLWIYVIVLDGIRDGDQKTFNKIKQAIAKDLRQIIRGHSKGIILEKPDVCGRDDITLRDMDGMVGFDTDSASYQIESEQSNS
jgi:hypothetical protein